MEDYKVLKIKVQKGIPLNEYEKKIITTQIDQLEKKAKQRLNTAHKKDTEKLAKKKTKAKPQSKPQIRPDVLIRRSKEIQNKLINEATKHEKIGCWDIGRARV